MRPESAANQRLSNTKEKTMEVQALRRKTVVKVTASSGHPAEIDPLLTFQQLSEMLNIPVVSLYNLRYRGKAPKAIRIGSKTLRFRRSDVEEWLRANESLTA
jgi:predicted DNA-binding transcriptional regulator AlpA